MPILIVSTAILLSLLYMIELYARLSEATLFLATFCFAMGFVLRPLVLFFFMRLSVKNVIALRVALVLIILNAVVYLSSLFLFAPDFSRLVLYYEWTNGVMEPHRGPLYFVSYVVTGVMMAYFVFVSITSLKGAHRYDALASLICAAFVGGAVLIETLLFDAYLLNTTIVIACLFYIVHLYQQASHRDGLTDLFDRRTYYADVSKFGSRVNGVILVDMNSLKRINDTEGHQAGDRAIITIANVLRSCCNNNYTYVYRMGGDEFMVLSLKEGANVMPELKEAIKAKMAETLYTVSIGFSRRLSEHDTVSEIAHRAEERMYEDKADYYRRTGIERRRA